MVDQPRLDHLLSNLRRYVGVLRQSAATPREQFLSNPDKVGNTKYHFVIAIGCATDIADYIIASERCRIPKDNGDSFVVLIEEGVLDAAQRDRLRAMARLRNRLVHLDWEVEDDRLWQYLQTSLDDLDAFARAVAAHPW